MTPPLCILPGCSKPVKRGWGELSPSARGLRIVDGQRWRWFCSAGCATVDRMASKGREQAAAASRANRMRCEQRIIQRLTVACKERMDERGRVDPKDFVRLVMRELRLQYQRQYGQLARCNAAGRSRSPHEVGGSPTRDPEKVRQAGTERACVANGQTFHDAGR